MSLAEEKNRLRAQLRQALSEISDQQRREAVKSLRPLLKIFLQEQDFDHIAAFAAMQDEINLDFLWQDFAEKELFLPRYRIKSQDYDFALVKSLEKDTITGKFSIREAKEKLSSLRKGQKALCLIPGLGFDTRGHRLGRGRAFYDRLLKNRETMNVAVCYDFQLCEAIPKEDWDICMDYIVTEKQIIKCK